VSRRVELHSLTIKDASELIRKKKVSPLDLVESTLDRIGRIENRVNAFVTVMRDEALQSARHAEGEIRRGFYRGPLHGIPVAVKDLVDTAGTRTTSGSKVRADYVPKKDAAVIERLRAAGAVIIGKTVTYEFAYVSVKSPTRNPWNLDRQPGGSSAGSGAAVSSGMCLAAIGTDTGGSIRVPSCFNGIVGLKPTYGLVSKRGVTTLAWTMDHVGPMTKTVEDAAIVLNVIAGFDRADPASIDFSHPDYTRSLRESVSHLRLGVPTNYFFERIDPEVEGAFRESIEVLRKLGAEIREIEIPLLEHTMGAEFTIIAAEATAYHEKSLRSKARLYDQEVRMFLELGELLPSRYYLKAQRVRGLIKTAIEGALKSVDLIVTPTSPVAPARLGQEEFRFEGVKENVLYAYVRNCCPFNLAGIPAVSVLCGFTHENLPIGLQIAGRAFDEAMVLQVAYAYESATDWHLRNPPI